MACRTTAKGEEVKTLILQTYPSASIDVIELDLSSMKSIRYFAQIIADRYDKLNCIINNAGIMAVPTRQLTQDGLELQIGTNHFGHFLLTALLFPLLSQDGRIINHSSEMHASPANNFPFTDIMSAESYSPWSAYGNSKAANVLFTYALNKKLIASGNSKNIISIAVHPGYSSTNLQRGRFPMWEQLNALFAMKAGIQIINYFCFRVL